MSPFDNSSPLPFSAFCRQYLRQKIFWKALIVSVPSGVLTYCWMSIDDSDIVQRLSIHGTAFSCLALLISVFVAFRASQAYSRYWDGTSALFSIRGRLYDVVSFLFSFSRHSSANPADVQDFRHSIVRLISMLETLCLADLSAEGLIDGFEDAFSYTIIDPTYFSEDTIAAINESEFPIDLIVQWLQSMIVEGMASNIITVPPPICTRVFHELQSGLASFHTALRITEVPIPFPYTAATHLVFVLFWLIVPLAASSWSESPGLCGSLATILVFALFVLNGVAGEMENPFGNDVNDLDVEHGHVEFNHRLWLMLSPTMEMMPSRASDVNLSGQNVHEILTKQTSFAELFASRPMAQFGHSKELIPPSSTLPACPPRVCDNPVPPQDPSNASGHANVSVGAIDIRSCGNDLLLSDEGVPVTQRPERSNSRPVIGQSQPSRPLHESGKSPGSGVTSIAHTRGSSDPIALVEAQNSHLHDRTTPGDECCL
eukprot:TRINITY_DN6399_c0_g1_i1.p1 TRINITY_DN6399_c0_g1~~TRINITY_DN6399_c0_g1_i1.p1  ORF type:complete len:486 (+),score=39.90 TRINITY_DN6399_c0_g1_i1:52-1509(+)